MAVQDREKAQATVRRTAMDERRRTIMPQQAVNHRRRQAGSAEWGSGNSTAPSPPGFTSPRSMHNGDLRLAETGSPKCRG